MLSREADAVDDVPPDTEVGSGEALDDVLTADKS